MTDEEIRKVCAEQFFGLEGVTEAENYWPGAGYFVSATVVRTDGVIVYCPDERHINKRYPDPLTSDADACAVLDRLEGLGWQTSVHGCPSEPPEKRYECQLNWWGESRRAFNAFAETRGRAICLAAFKAIGAEV